MRLLHIADVHLERSFGWLGYPRGSRRRGELRRTLEAAVDLAASEQVDALCIAGDLYEADNAGDAIGGFLRESFSRLRVPVLIAPGNHDPFRPGCLYDRVSWSDNVRIFRAGALTSIPIGDGCVWGRAFHGPEDFGSPLAGFRVPGDGLHLGLLHADIVAVGVTSKFAPLEPSDIAASGLKHLMLGHIHAGRIDDASRYAYTGSIEPLDISESGAHWALLVDAHANGVRITRHQLARRRVVSDRIDVTEVASLSQFRQIIASKRDLWEGNNVQLRIDGSLVGELLLQPEGIGEALAQFDVDLDLAARPPVDLDALAAQKTTLGAFVLAAREKMRLAPSDVERRAAADILAAGVAAFSGQELFLG